MKFGYKMAIALGAILLVYLLVPSQYSMDIALVICIMACIGSELH